MNTQKNLFIALLIIVIVFFVEIAGGFVSNSLALMSDAGHMLTDAMALLLALLATIFSSRPATREKTYGFYRLEILSALFNGSILVLVAIYIFYEAFQRFLHPLPVKTDLMLMVATIGLFSNLGAAVVLAGSSKENLSVRGAFLHVLSDLASSVAVIVSGIIILFTRWYYVDPLLSLLIGALILRGAAGLVYDSANVLLEAIPKGMDLDEVLKTICEVEGVEDVHDLHVWSIASGINAVSAHVVIEDRAAGKSLEIISGVKKLLKEKYNITHSTFQTECEACPEGIICSVKPAEREGHGH